MINLQVFDAGHSACETGRRAPRRSRKIGGAMNDSIEACNAGNAILGISRYQNRSYDTSLDGTPTASSAVG